MSDDSFIPPLHPAFSYRVDRVGNEQQPVLIVDNFLEGAEALVGFAMEYCEFGPGGDYYPGIQAKVPSFYTRALYTYLRDIIAETFTIDVRDINYSKSMYSVMLTPPEKLAVTQSRPHTDSLNNNQLATVHYLCTPDKGGTSLYRHRATGYESLDVTKFSVYEKFLTDEEKDLSWQKKYIAGSNQYYEEIARYEAAFNRVIMYRGNCLHSASVPADFGFEPHPVKGRLTLNSFIYFK